MTGAVKLTTPGAGSVIVQPASSIASDVTVNVPSQNCTLGIQGPAFSAYLGSAQTLTSGVFTKIQANSKEWDTANCFDATTNYRFTPNVAGYYQVSCATKMLSAASSVNLYIYKNGSIARGLTNQPGQILYTASGSATVYLNGSTDYIEFYVQLGTGQGIATGAANTYFQAFLARSA